MADYSKMKNADLEKLLKDRSLPHTGKKADLIQRLQESDQAPGAGSTAAAAPAKPAEDEIDWDDEPATTTAAAATTEPAAAALAAGGQGQAVNPQAVPNQVSDIDPAQTDDLSASKPTDAAPTTDAPAEVPAEPAKAAVDFSSGMAPTTADEEIAKRKARAKKFGLDESTDEALKAVERSKRFGGGDMSHKLDEALPERRERKRGREGGEEDGGRKRGQSGRPGAGPRRGSGRLEVERKSTPKPNGGSGGSWMSDADRAKAEARKAKFATAS